MGNKIKDTYQAQGWTRLTLSAAIGVQESTLWRWEQGAKNMGAVNLAKLCQALGKGPNELGLNLIGDDDGKGS